MRIPEFKYTCSNHHVFRDAGAPREYGCFVARGARSNIPSVVRLLQDPLYEELADQAVHLAGVTGRGKLTRAVVECVQSAFGSLCDDTPDGDRPVLNGRARCDKCGADAISWAPTGKAYEGPTFEVSHSTWDELPAVERRARVTAALRLCMGRFRSG